jgi:hypothetical protein
LRLEALEGRWVPTTLTPTTFLDGGLGSGSLRDAVLQLNADTGTDDDIIQLEAGTYALTIPNVGGRHETAGLTGDLNLNQTSHRWIIQGAGPSTIIDASQLQDRVFQIVNPGTQVVFQDLVIQGGLAQDDGTDGALAGTTDALGGGIFNNGGNVTLDNVVLQNNVARGGDAVVRSVPGHNARGGGFYSTGGALTVAGATLANNQAIGGRGGDYGGEGGSAAGGGLYASGASLDIANNTIGGNRATGGRGGDGFYYTYSGSAVGGEGGGWQGGGLYVNGGSVTIASSTIASNQGTGGPGGNYGVDGDGIGGGLYNRGTLTVSTSTLSGNTDGIFNDGTLTVSNSTLSGNTGRGIFIDTGMVTVTGSTLSSNTGVGISIYSGTLTVSDSTLSSNTGGGISSSGTLTVNNSSLSGNTATSYGGGIYNVGFLTVSNSTLSGNHAGSEGGGIFNASSGRLTVSNSTLSGNSAGQGGGIFNWNTLTVSNSTLSGNDASAEGGGIYNYTGTVTVSNSTLSGNSGEDGGGIYANSSTPVTLTNVTLTANRATFSGGGLYVGFGSTVLHNTLIAGNFRGATGATPDDVYGRLDSRGDYNLIGDGTGMSGLSNGVNGNLVGSADNPIDPLLGPLDDNGGPTLTHALLSGSPAIDAGNNAYATAWDQRGPGYPRIVNGIIDIGAFEVQAPAASYPTRPPLSDPVPVQALGMPGGPLLGQPPDLPADPSPVPEPGNPQAPAGQLEPAAVPAAGEQQAPETLFVADAANRQPAHALGPPDASDLDPLAQELLEGP